MVIARRAAVRTVQVYDGDGKQPDADPYVHERYDANVRATRKRARWVLDTLLAEERELTLLATMTLSWLAGVVRTPPPGLGAQALAKALEDPRVDLGVAIYCARMEGKRDRARRLNMASRKLNELAKLLRGG